jgi:gliding motility-associated-like protein
MQKAGSPTIDEGISISSDPNGNTYATGYFTSHAAFGLTNLITAGAEDIFLTKLNNAGLYQWTVKAGGSGSDRPTSVKTDATGNSYITGYFSDTAAFGAYNLISTGLQDIFIAKYNTAGICLWAKRAGGSEGDIGNGITVDVFGNVIVTGQFTGTATFGSFVLTSINNSVNTFTAKLDSLGNFIWVKQGASSQTNIGVGIVCDVLGNAIVTGQFSDTITFEFVHNNTLTNSIFMIKYDSSGAEQWFKIISSNISNVVTSIAIDTSGNPLIAGNFQGTMTFFNAPNNTTLSNAYINRIFVAKYDSLGNLIWSTSSGSNGNIIVNSIAVNRLGNPYVVGDFSCKLNEYADQYGQGTFNSVGYTDIYITEWSPSGQWLWSRQAGGHQLDNGAGITINDSNKILLTGSFGYDLIFPEVYTNFLGYNTSGNSSCNSPYCSDPNYNQYEEFFTAGNLDIFIANAVDTARQTYDFYKRTGVGCNRDVLNGSCISKLGDTTCLDSVLFCTLGAVQLNMHNCNVINQNGIAPDYTYEWSNGFNVIAPVDVNYSGYLYVSITSEDGCFQAIDSIFVTMDFVNEPLITDNRGFNYHAINTVPIGMCIPDSALLTASNYGTDQFRWVDISVPYYYPYGDSTVEVNQSDTMVIEFTDSYGCTSSNSVIVNIDSSILPPILSGMMILIQDTSSIHRHDTVTICEDYFFTMYLFDSLTNPIAHPRCVPNSMVVWSVIQNTIDYGDTTFCDTILSNNTFYPHQSGWYTISADWIRFTACDTVDTVITRNIYANLLDTPNVQLTWVGNPFLCPGDSNLLTITGYPYYHWESPNHFGTQNNPIWATQTGIYQASETVTLSDGCSSHALVFFTVQTTSQPSITIVPTNGIICPLDSVQLICSGSGNFIWESSSGPFGADSDIVYVDQPGNYYCIETDTNNCTLISNTITTELYSAPYLVATPDTIICNGDSLLLTVMTNDANTIQWQSPFSGSSLTQWVYAPGIYSCLVNSCNINTLASISIGTSHAIASFAPDTLIGCAPYTIHFINTSSNASSYLWNFGDNTTDVSTNPTHTYSNIGTYNVSLVCYVTGSCNDTFSKIITVNPTAVAAFTANPLTGCSPLNVQFSNTSTNANNYEWSFGDNSTSTSTNPNHTYTDSGHFTITLIAINHYGCNDTNTLTNYITVINPIIPASSFTTTIHSGCNPLTIPFSNTSTNGTSFLWNFGDGNTDTSMNPTHTFDSSGIFTITLITTNTSLCGIVSDTSIQTNYINVFPKAIASFTPANAYSCNPLTINFINGSTNAIAYHWAFGDGDTSNLSAPNYTYDTAGNFSVTLIAYGAGGCNDTITQSYFSIRNKPVIKTGFYSDTLNGCTPLTITFTNNSSNGTSCLWRFGDGDSSLIFNPTYTFHDSGVYTITLININDTSICGRIADTVIQTDYIAVADPVKVTSNFLAIPNSGCPPLPINIINNSTNGTSYFWNFGNGDTSNSTTPTKVIYLDSGIYTITLISFNNNARCYNPPDTVSMVIYADSCHHAFPNVFSPNSDGHNDLFNIEVSNTTNFHLIIFNRWGQKLFETFDPDEGWNGKTKSGKDVPDGTYYYLFTADDINGNPFSDPGYITLIR